MPPLFTILCHVSQTLHYCGNSVIRTFLQIHTLDAYTHSSIGNETVTEELLVILLPHTPPSDRILKMNIQFMYCSQECINTLNIKALHHQSEGETRVTR